LKGKSFKFYDERPFLFEDLAEVWTAFWRLHSSRLSGMGGAEPLQIQSIIDYGNNVIKCRNIEEFIDYIQALDSTMLNHLRRLKSDD